MSHPLETVGVEAKHAPAPWDWDASGKPGSNGDFNLYVVDASKRKIAAVWGRREERECTARLIAGAPALLEACHRVLAAMQDPSADLFGCCDVVRSAIALAEGSGT